MATATLDSQQKDKRLLQLLEERKLGQFLGQAFDKPKDLLFLLKDAGAAGVVAYLICFVIFYSVAGSLGELVYHSASGQWLDPREVFLEDGTTRKAETLALLASFYLACKPLAPLRIGGALLLTPDVNRFIEARPALVSALAVMEKGLDASVGAGVRTVSRAIAPIATALTEAPPLAPLRRSLLKTELLELAQSANGGIEPLPPRDQERLEEIAFTLLPELNPTPEPTRSATFSGVWACQWTDEKEINFARQKGKDPLVPRTNPCTHALRDIPRDSHSFTYTSPSPSCTCEHTMITSLPRSPATLQVSLGCHGRERTSASTSQRAPS